MRELLGNLESGPEPSDPDPVRRARNQMKGPVIRRFYKSVSIAEEPDGHSVRLDGRPVKTPSGKPLLVPTTAAARLVADEYDSQGETVEPASMPVTRLVNTAIDGVAADPQAVLEDILRYSASDLVCYRADGPDTLANRQAEAWDPVIDWARSTLGARFAVGQGIVHVDQPRESVGAIGVHLRQRDDPFTLASLHVLTTITGSALLALMFDAGAMAFDAMWSAAHVDEDWNIEHWGFDAEAVRWREGRRRDAAGAAALIEAIRTR